jgi:hypothetical protein
MTYSSEMSIDFQRTTRYHIVEGRTLHNRHCENLKSYIFKLFYVIRASNIINNWKYVILGLYHGVRISRHNSIQFFITYVPSQQVQGQLQTQHSVDKSSYIREKLNIKSKTN